MTVAPVTAGAIPWWQSPQQIKTVATEVSVLAAFLPKSKIVAALGLSDPNTVSGYITSGAGALAGALLAWSFVQRIFSKIQPLTLTKAGAAIHPATLARVETTTAMSEAGITPSGIRAAQIQVAQSNTAVKAALVAAPSTQSQIVTQVSPEVVTVVAKAFVAEFAAAQAHARAVHEKSLSPAPVVTAPSPQPLSEIPK